MIPCFVLQWKGTVLEMWYIARNRILEGQNVVKRVVDSWRGATQMIQKTSQLENHNWSFDK